MVNMNLMIVRLLIKSAAAAVSSQSAAVCMFVCLCILLSHCLSVLCLSGSVCVVSVCVVSGYVVSVCVVFVCVVLTVATGGPMWGVCQAGPPAASRHTAA